ncbi:MAG: HAD family hydrolase [Deltaproteobacteria bacterium]|nr:MAG: HAD family hydrolase [Deltaproteobacteria bacterium]
MPDDAIDPIEMPPPERGIYCNRTLNLRSLRAVGFDMDYTLIHYRPEEWELRAYEHLRGRLVERGWPVGDHQFDAQLITLGLIVDLELGNVVKANRFGYIKKAMHGTRVLPYPEQRKAYSGEHVDLREDRWVFMNTLFGLSEGCMFLQVVDLYEEGLIPNVHSYRDLYRAVRESLDETHMEGELKAEIARNPTRFVVEDPELPLALLDLKHAGKKLLLITNSEWTYTRDMMRSCFDAHLPGDMTWRDLFDVKIVGARKPGFFGSRASLFQVVDEEGLLRPARSIEDGGIYLGGNASLVEEYLGTPGDDIIYFGDHIFADVNVSKSMLRWRTGLVVRELEDEVRAIEEFKPKQRQLQELMDDKVRMEHRFSELRIQLQRLRKRYGPKPAQSAADLEAGMKALRTRLVALDGKIAPLAKEAGELMNANWGLLMRTGNDKSHLARQIERYADIYTSRVSNLLLHTPFIYARSPRGSLPHDSGPEGGV